MDDILGGELAIPEVELHTLSERERPFFLIRAGFPLLSQAGDVVAGLGVEVKEGLQEWVVLQMVGRVMVQKRLFSWNPAETKISR